ncbi:MAG: periplasmic heavy metal sensor [Verrucomicrobiae bacterium]|nr:periplasmic heavy metal sensor [Verrucomicrobiae bacterium]
MKKLSLIAVALIAAIGITSNVNAQPAGGAGQGGRGAGFGVTLNDDQRQALRTAMEKQQDQFNQLNEKLQAAQKEFMQAVLAAKQDEKVIKEKADAVAKIQSEILVLRAKAFGEIAPSLSQEQKDQLINSRFGIMMMQGPGFMRGPGAGAPGAPGAGGGQGQGRRGNRGGGANQ